MSEAKREIAGSPLLISAADLAAATGPTTPVIVDCRFNLMQPDAGRAAYEAGHIPGAWYADLDRDLSGHREAHTGRHPLPGAEQLRVLFGGFGIGPATRVVAYDEGGGGLAARLWWLLRWMGHRDAVLLDGGLAAWLQGGFPLSQGNPEPRPTIFHGEPGHMPVLHTAQVVAALADDAIQLLDARAEERFRGRVEPIDPVAGHVPGASNMPFGGNLAADNRFKTPEELVKRYAPLVEGRDLKEIVFMCGSGVTACHGIFALELAGLPGAVLYPGSWSEWIRSPERPVATDR